MTKTEYNRKKRAQGKAIKQDERAWKGTAQSYSGIMFGPVLHRRTGLERFRAQKPALNVDGKPAKIDTVGHSLGLIARLREAQRGRNDDIGEISINVRVNRALQAQADRIRARLPVVGI